MKIELPSFRLPQRRQSLRSVVPSAPLSPHSSDEGVGLYRQRARRWPDRSTASKVSPSDSSSGYSSSSTSLSSESQTQETGPRRSARPTHSPPPPPVRSEAEKAVRFRVGSAGTASRPATRPPPIPETKPFMPLVADPAPSSSLRPPPRPPKPLALRNKAASVSVSDNGSRKSKVGATPPPRPPPPPPPAALLVPSVVKKASETKEVDDDARVNLMESIRNVGGFGGARLKRVPTNSTSSVDSATKDCNSAGGNSPPATPSNALPSDFAASLKAKMSSLRVFVHDSSDEDDGEEW